MGTKSKFWPRFALGFFVTMAVLSLVGNGVLFLIISVLAEDNRECQSRFSQGTVLYQKEAPAIRVLDDLIELRPGGALGQAAAQPVVQWYIPAKIEPVVYGNADRYLFMYYDPATRKLDGPYVPKKAQ